jgi:proline dehydrogenase
MLNYHRARILWEAGLRAILLAASQNAWLRNHATKYKFVRRGVSRFMPGESLDHALHAARTLQESNIGAILTYLGENVRDAVEAGQVTAQYLEALRRVRESQMHCEISVKLTQLGLDLSPELCYQNLQTILSSETQKRVVWIDMEASNYVDITLTLYRRALQEFPNVGLCLQAYLYRTKDDLAALLPLRSSIRLVKGAYDEPAEIAFPKKADVDKNYFALAKEMLLAKKVHPSMRSAFGTHDPAMIDNIARFAAASALPPGDVEIQMLYGIQSAQQKHLAQHGYTSRVLISYGTHWYPWFVRRLAERPANLWFMLRHLF